MPRRYGKKRGRKPRRRAARKKNVVTLSNHQARTKAYDSKIEKVIARVARQEDAKQKQRLIFRQYLFGPYTIATNVFGGGRKVDFAGVVVPLAQIQLQDQVTAPKVIPAANPNQNPQTWHDPGVNVIGPGRSYDGFRRGTWISIHGLSIELRSSVLALSAVAAPLYDSCTLKYKVILAMWDGSDVTDARPEMEDLGSYIKRFGFSTKLNLTEFEETKLFKVRNLFSGKLQMRCNTLNSDVKFRSHYVDLSQKPVKIEYLDAEQNGRRINRWKPFIVFQSDIPAGAGYDVYKPEIHACTKLYYTDT